MAKQTKSLPPKYSDKSAGQPELVSLFDAIKKEMAHYVKGNYTIKVDKPGIYDIYYGTDVEIGGKRFPELCFAGLIVQKGYVGFYYFPIYLDPSLKNKLHPELLEKLKGKTCFHIKKTDGDLLKPIAHALKIGYDYYAARGWK